MHDTEVTLGRFNNERNFDDLLLYNVGRISKKKFHKSRLNGGGDGFWNRGAGRRI